MATAYQPPGKLSLAWVLGLSDKPFKEQKPPPAPKPPGPGQLTKLVTTPGALTEWLASDGRRGRLTGEGKRRLTAANLARDPTYAELIAMQGSKKSVRAPSKAPSKASKKSVVEDGFGMLGGLGGALEALANANLAGDDAVDDVPNPHGFTKEHDDRLMELKTNDASLSWIKIGEEVGKPQHQCKDRFKQIKPKDWKPANAKSKNKGGGGEGKKGKGKNQNQNQETNEEAAGGNDDGWGDGGWGGVNNNGGNDDNAEGAWETSGDYTAAEAWANDIETGKKSIADLNAHVGGNTCDNNNAADNKSNKSGKSLKSALSKKSKVASNTNPWGDDSWGNNNADDNKSSKRKKSKAGSNAGGWNSGGDEWGNNDTGGGGDDGWGNNDAGGGGNDQWGNNDADGGGGDDGWGTTNNNNDGGGDNPWGTNDNNGGKGDDPFSGGWPNEPDNTNSNDKANNWDNAGDTWGALAPSKKADSRAPSKHTPRSRSHSHSRSHKHKHTSGAHSNHKSSQRSRADRNTGPEEVKITANRTFSRDEIKLIARIMQQDVGMVWDRVSFKFRDKTGRNLPPAAFEKAVMGTVRKRDRKER